MCLYRASFYPIFVEEFKENVYHPLIVAANKQDGNSLPFSLVGPTQDELVHGLLTRPKSSDESSNGDEKLLHPLIKMVISFLTNLHQADGVLFNSFDRLDYEFIKWMENIWKVKTIGPLLPSPYLNKHINKGLNPYNPSNEPCMNWLNAQQPSSVVYIAFGTCYFK
ncbi:unnamed protein product [Amaranthus hypochondriacus]